MIVRDVGASSTFEIAGMRPGSRPTFLARARKVGKRSTPRQRQKRLVASTRPFRQQALSGAGRTDAASLPYQCYASFPCGHTRPTSTCCRLALTGAPFFLFSAFGFVHNTSNSQQTIIASKELNLLFPIVYFTKTEI